MDKKEITKELKSICQLDIDAMHAYKQALNHIDNAEIRNNIAQFQADHGRHIQDLSDTINAYGDNPPEFSKDFKGFVLESFTSMRSASGTEGALKALRTGEKMTNKQYGKAVDMDFPPDVLVLLQRNFDDEQRHLNYIEFAISQRTWERKAA